MCNIKSLNPYICIVLPMLVKFLGPTTVRALALSLTLLEDFIHVIVNMLIPTSKHLLVPMPEIVNKNTHKEGGAFD